MGSRGRTLANFLDLSLKDKLSTLASEDILVDEKDASDFTKADWTSAFKDYQLHVEKGKQTQRAQKEAGTSEQRPKRRRKEEQKHGITLNVQSSYQPLLPVSDATIEDTVTKEDEHFVEDRVFAMAASAYAYPRKLIVDAYNAMLQYVDANLTGSFNWLQDSLTFTNCFVFSTGNDQLPELVHQSYDNTCNAIEDYFAAKARNASNAKEEGAMEELRRQLKDKEEQNAKLTRENAVLSYELDKLKKSTKGDETV